MLRAEPRERELRVPPLRVFSYFYIFSATSTHVQGCWLIYNLLVFVSRSWGKDAPFSFSRDTQFNFAEAARATAARGTGERCVRRGSCEPRAAQAVLVKSRLPSEMLTCMGVLFKWRFS